LDDSSIPVPPPLTTQLHFVVPWIDRPKRFSFRYYVSNGLHVTELVTKLNQYRISTQNEVLDFPAQAVITRDGAMLLLDAVLNFKITSPKTMIYSCYNLPMMLSKVVQAQIRNVGGMLDVDQIIEDTAAMDRVGGEVAMITSRWGTLWRRCVAVMSARLRCGVNCVAACACVCVCVCVCACVWLCVVVCARASGIHIEFVKIQRVCRCTRCSMLVSA
jgi:regulator of protease activity HflC (stomatin/prohibitin superfamily)